MKAPIFIRSFSDRELETLEAGLRSKDTFTLRCSQMLLASSRGDEVPQLHGVADICTVGTWTNLTRLTFDCTEFLHGREWCQSGLNRAYSC